MSSAVFLLVISTLGLCVIAELDQKSLNRLRASNYFTRVALNMHETTAPTEPRHSLMSNFENTFWSSYGNRVVPDATPSQSKRSTPDNIIPTKIGGQQLDSDRGSSSYWKKVFEDRDKEDDSNFETDAVRLNSSAGYETDKYCVYDLRMAYFFGSPDGVKKRIIGFNGQFPGPTLLCTVGKTMIVRVTNDIDDDNEPTSIHWHGIQQTLTPFYDGPQSVTQCPVIRDTSMIYKFQVFQAGTYWYHSHHSYQYVDGAWGFLIVKNKPTECWQNSYDDERLISINDWFHRPARNLSDTYLIGGRFPTTNSSLINGRGTFNCSNIEPGQICNSALQGPSVVEVTRGKRYRFRLLNSSAGNIFNFSIDAHKFVVIETDGVDTKKSPKVDMVQLYPGQRYSLIVIMDKPLGEYWIRISGEPTVVAGPPGRAVLRYSPNPEGFRCLRRNAEPKEPGKGVTQSRPAFNDIPWDDLHSRGGVKVPTREELGKYFPHQPAAFNPLLQSQLDEDHAQLVRKLKLPTSKSFDPATVVVLDQNRLPPLNYGIDGGGAPARCDRLVIINQSDCPLPDAPVRMCMNGEPYAPRGTNSPPILYNVIEGAPVPSSARPISTPNQREVIRVAINNRHRFAHPWHLHGHSFWVLGVGEEDAGDFVPSRDNSNLTTRGVRRDTTFTLKNSWAVIEYVTDNPGTWFFHCHINWHLEAGLGMTFIESEGIARQIYKFPPVESLKTCARVGVSLFD